MILYDHFKRPTITWLYKMEKMNEINQIQDDEIDLFDFVERLWNGKWLISSFVAIAVLLGVGFISLKDPVYESKLIFSVGTIPPYSDENTALADFQKIFYSVNVFEEWKQNNSNTSLVFKDFSDTEVVDGFLLSKNQSLQLATFISAPVNKDGSFILVKSNQLPILDDFFKYAQHINKLLENEYIVRSNENLKIIETRFKDLDIADSKIINTLLSIKRYIFTANKGAGVLRIKRPTMPKKVSPKSKLILAMSLVLGGMIGVAVILVRDTITKRKERLGKT